MATHPLTVCSQCAGVRPCLCAAVAVAAAALNRVVVQCVCQERVEFVLVEAAQVEFESKS